MVCQLNAAQTYQTILALPEAQELRIPEPINLQHIAETCRNMVAQASGRAFGWFDDAAQPQGILVGVIIPDLFTGELGGYEHIWWVNRSHRGKASVELRERFEKECREAGCKRITFGFSLRVDGGRMNRMYQRLGYEPYLITMSKRI